MPTHAHRPRPPRASATLVHAATPSSGNGAIDSSAGRLRTAPTVQRLAAVGEQLNARHTAAPRSDGLPAQLKAGVEALSGLSMDDVRVHRNSAKPAQLQAHAYAQGTNIHLGPGQERHLPHEAWHVVQQKQGRVVASMSHGSVAINDDSRLEREADAMGARASAGSRKANSAAPVVAVPVSATAPVQRMTVGYTGADLGHPPAAPLAFADQIIQFIIHQRAGIPTAVRHAVDAFADNAPMPPNSYKHHVGYDVIYQRLRNACEGHSRTDIVDKMEVRCDLAEINTGGFGNPLAHVAGFNSWLDAAFVALCDWPANIFRGTSTGAEPDAPIGGPAALTNRLQDAREVLDDVD